MRKIDWSGHKFGKLKAISFSHYKSGSYWNFVCDCGGTAVKPIWFVRNGIGDHCGCSNPKRILHSQKMHNLHHSIMQRCYDKKNHKFHRYGGRGIKVCDEWQDYKTFYLWAIRGYETGLELNRIDNNGNYEPNNCNWITHRENMNNTVRTVYYKFYDEQITVSYLAEKIGKTYSFVKYRLKRNWTAEQIYEGFK